MHRLLIVHPDPSTRGLMSSMLHSLGHRIDEAASDSAAARMLEQHSFGLVLAGAEQDVSEALELLNLVRRKHGRTPMVLFAASPQPEQIREATQRGALSFLKFPLPASQLRAAVAQALPELEPAPFTVNGESRRHQPAANRLNGVYDHTTSKSAISVLDLASVSPFHEHNGNGHTNGSLNGNGIAHANPGVMNETLIAGDPIMRQVLDLTDAIATRRSSVLIVGEPGTGKKTLARLLHSKSARRDGPFVVFSCQGRRESELEVELLGRTGSGTEAETQGLLGRAAGGTLFLDDVQCLSPSLQLHVLRAVRGAEVGQNGGDKPRSECRLVLGCSEELGPLVERGQFRSDLFYALSAVTIQLPPLRHRSEDITSLAEHFRDEYSTKYGKSIVGISPDAARRLASHDWPQNVAELRTTIEQAVQRCRGHWIEANHLGLDSPTGSAAREGLGGLSAALRQSILPLKEALEEPEKRLILEALRALNWNRQETARVLDINRTTLYKKMKKYGLIFEEPVWAN